MISQQIKELITDSLKKNNLEIPGNFVIEKPENDNFGDYSSNIALVLGQPNNINPRQIAEKISQSIQEADLIEKIEIAGPGFLNFWIKKEKLMENWQLILNKSDEAFSLKIGKNQKVVFDYAAPNIAKPFHVGHLRSTIIGQADINIHQALGYQTIGINHIGDWGTQFGKQIYAIKTWGNWQKIAKNPIEELVALYVKFHQEAEKNPALEKEGRRWFKKLEDQDPEAREIWQKIIDWSNKDFDELFQILGIKFDQTMGESFYEDKMAEIIKEGQDKGVFKPSQGALIVEFPKEKLPTAIVLKSDQATNYLTRDLATLKYRLKTWQSVKIIYHVGAEQILHFTQVFATANQLGWLKGKEIELIIADHGLYRLKEGKLSTRKGRVIKVREIIEEARQRVTKVIEEKSANLTDKEKAQVIEDVAISALKYNDLKQNRKTDILFDWDKILNLHGNSGPYLQYTVARIYGLFRRAGIDPARGVTIDQLSVDDFNDQEINMLRQLIHYPEILVKAGQLAMPHYLCDYLYQLAENFNQYYDRIKILDDDEKIKNLRLTFAFSIAIILTNGLQILGIKVPTKL